eukprot:gene14118-19614_t
MSSPHYHGTGMGASLGRPASMVLGGKFDVVTGLPIATITGEEGPAVIVSAAPAATTATVTTTTANSPLPHHSQPEEYGDATTSHVPAPGAAPVALTTPQTRTRSAADLKRERKNIHLRFSVFDEDEDLLDEEIERLEKASTGSLMIWSVFNLIACPFGWPCGWMGLFYSIRAKNDGLGIKSRAYRIGRSCNFWASGKCDSFWYLMKLLTP